MEFREVFDTIPEQFDKWRPHYCNEAFNCIIDNCKLDSKKSVLEIGPGTGQATESILKTGCDYLAIELGGHLAQFTKDKFKDYRNFSIINDDFETYNFEQRKYDLVFSAAAIQWIPEQIAFSRAFDLLKPGGTLAMMYIRGDYKTPNEKLFNNIQKVYAAYFHPEMPYRQKMNYSNAVNYGFIDFTCFEFASKREFTADEYVEYIGTHSDHIVLKEPEKSEFYKGIRSAILNAENRIEFKDTVVLYLARKPENINI